MARKLKEFIKDWQVNSSNESATHVSGLKFRHLLEGSDGREKIYISGWPQWAQSFIEKGHTTEECDKMQDQLYYEFVDIYEHVIKPSHKVMILERVQQTPTIAATASPNLEEEKKDPVTVNTEKAISNKGMFKRPFSFKGRIRRLEYCISYIIYFIWDVVRVVVYRTSVPSPIVSIFFLISFIPMLWFLCAQNTKRCHDRGNSGWYQLIPLYILWMMFGKGDTGENEYGDNPKE